jgi:CRP-like cAMP-binding protein
MELTFKPEEVLLPEQFLDEAKRHLDSLFSYHRDKLVLLEDNVIPSLVMMRYDRLTKLLQAGSAASPAAKGANFDRSSLSKPQSMLLTIRDRIHFFDGMSEDEILSVLKHVDFLRLKKNETIFEQFSTGQEIYYIIKGDVAISGYMEKGAIAEDNHASLTILEEGQVFGELGPILGESRSARASVASPDAFIMVMELKDEESFAMSKVYRNLMRSLARKLIRTNNQLYPFICD